MWKRRILLELLGHLVLHLLGNQHLLELLFELLLLHLHKKVHLHVVNIHRLTQVMHQGIRLLLKIIHINLVDVLSCIDVDMRWLGIRKVMHGCWLRHLPLVHEVVDLLSVLVSPLLVGIELLLGIPLMASATFIIVHSQ